MNSDYIISGRGETALLGASWAARSDSGRARAEEVSASATEPTPQKTDIKSAAVKESTAKARSTDYVEDRRNKGPEVHSNEDFSFDDLVDIINPLNHIPVLNVAYRELTGSKISGFAQVAGGLLYGGIVGMASGIVNAVVEEETGKDMAGTAIAALTGKESIRSKEPVPGEPTGETMVAENTVEAEVEIGDAPEAVPTDAIESRTLLADASNIIDKKPAEAKKPFGGIYDTEIAQRAKAGPASVEVAQNDIVERAAESTDTVEASDAAAVGATPLAKGQKFYSLGSVPRFNDGQVRMPLHEATDRRFNPMGHSRSVASKPAEKLGDIPLASKEQTQKILGLNGVDNAPEVAMAPAAASSDLATPASLGKSNPLPPQLIEDMMMQGISKYQKGIESGTFKAPTVDISG